MFSFHKPKIYRSNNGCCICKAKSSSSRFTDSKKYETEFERCFLIKEVRSGEICNACVLLVKRCKKLPKETNKHWAHVVDARAGPGTKSHKNAKATPNKTQAKASKSVTPSKTTFEPAEPEVKSKNSLTKKSSTPKKLCSGTETRSNSSSGNSSDSNDEDEDYMSDYEQRCAKEATCSRMRTRNRASVKDEQLENKQKRTESSTSNSNVTTIKKTKQKSKPCSVQKQRAESTFLDMSYWKREKVCCGVIFRSKCSEMVLIDTNQFKPCKCAKTEQNVLTKHELTAENELETTLEMTADAASCALGAEMAIGSSPGSAISSGISSASSDVCSVTEGEEEEDNSNSCSASIPVATASVRTFGVL